MFYWLGAFDSLESNNRKPWTQSRWNFVCLCLSFPVSLNFVELQGSYEKFSADIRVNTDEGIINWAKNDAEEN